MGIKWEDYDHKMRFHNDTNETYREMFKGKEIVIPPKSYIDMEYFKGCRFKGSPTPMKYKDPVDGKRKVNTKKLRSEHIMVPLKGNNKKEKFICPMTGKEFKTKAEMHKHMVAYSEGSEYRPADTSAFESMKKEVNKEAS